MNDQERREQRKATFNNAEHRHRLAARIGGTIGAQRAQAGITPEQIELLIGIKPKRLADIENGKFLPSSDMLEAIANCIGCHLEIVKND